MYVKLNHRRKLRLKHLSPKQKWKKGVFNHEGNSRRFFQNIFPFIKFYYKKFFVEVEASRISVECFESKSLEREIGNMKQFLPMSYQIFKIFYLCTA